MANTTHLAESTVKFVGTCQNIAKGVYGIHSNSEFSMLSTCRASSDDFEGAFVPLLETANAVNNSLKFLHFDQGQKEFRLRRF